MNTIYFMCSVVLIGFVSSQVQSAPILNPNNGHWYEEVLSRVTTWEQARDLAEQREYLGFSGHLVTITSAEEQSWLNSNLTQAIRNRGYIGAFQLPGSPEPNGGWQWVTGEEWDYEFWAPGEPNNQQGDNHAHIDGRNPFGSWNDGAPGSTAVEAFIVEYSVPEPSTASLLLIGVAALLRRRS